MTTRQSFTILGIDTSVEVARWIWETGFRAVAGDTPGFKAMEVNISGKERGLGGLPLPEFMLGGWGMPIGEYSLGCYSFFLASMPLNVPGGVATPSNMVAIF